jgi:alkylation response protein AidB-like acyl-CoA dehydrogenase
MASSTVQLTFTAHPVPQGRVTGTLPLDQWRSRDAAGLRANGSLALGLAARSCELIGPGPRAGSSLTAEPLPMVAVMASSTVQLSFTGHPVPQERVTGTLPLDQWRSRDAAGLRANGSLALGLAARSCELIGPGPLDEQLAHCRAALDSADPDSMPGARAAACELALRATAALVVIQGSSAILADHDAQRLAREALFLLVFGSRPPIKESLAGLLTNHAR